MILSESPSLRVNCYKVIQYSELLSYLRSTWHKCVQHDTNAFNMTQMRSTWHKYVQHDTNTFNMTQTRSTWHKCVQHNTNTFNMTQIRSTWHKCVQHDTNTFNMKQMRSTWHKYVQHDTSIVIKFHLSWRMNQLENWNVCLWMEVFTYIGIRVACLLFIGTNINELRKHWRWSTCTNYNWWRT